MEHEGKSKALPLWGSESSMNLNALILTNIQNSNYFKVSLFKLKTYHEVIDEIYYEVKHMEPWEKGSRKTSGQTGMCGGVRGVGAGGIVSSAYCLLYKLFTLRLTRKQLNGLLTHTDSPYIRALGFMYIRYTQPPADLFDWYEEYLQDEEEIDVKAGGGQTITIGQMLVQWLTKLDWFATLFPRIPVPIQKQIQSKLEEYAREYGTTVEEMTGSSTSQKPGPNRAPAEKGGRNYQDNNNRYNQQQQRGESSSGGSGGSGSRYRPDRSRSPPPRSSNYQHQDRGYGHSRRSPDRYSHSSRRSGGSDRDDYYERDQESYRSSSASSHRKRY